MNVRQMGGGTINSSGYRVIFEDGQRVLEHRFVMEQVLGRTLKPFENVHHVNGQKIDNRPSNLELWAHPQPSGQRAVDLAEWVVENYPELVVEALNGRMKT